MATAISTDDSPYSGGSSSRSKEWSLSISDFNETRTSINNTLSLPWDNFHSWISCICVVTFDLEVGQVIEKIFPENYQLSETERMNICYLAFPDSNTGCMGDTVFHFRIRSPLKCKIRYSKTLYASLNKDPNHYFGYVAFRQVKDPTIKRGYFQKSVIILTRLPYINFFRYIVKIIAPEYFQNGDVAIETVCAQIDKWNQPHPGQTFQLPVMGEVLQMNIPSHNLKSNTKILPQKMSLTKEVGFSMSFDSDFYKSFSILLPHLHLIWELVLLSEPIVVMASSPSICSDIVQTLVELIQPLHFVNDYRPYFTIHDSELNEYTTKTQQPPNIIIGVTNPFFAKTLQAWPHVLRVGEMPALTVVKNGPGQKLQNLKPGIYTKYKPCLDKDKMFFKKLGGKQTNGQRPVEVQNSMIKRFIEELTQSFIIPLERYIGSLMPLQRSISPWKTPPKLRNFNESEFLQTLSEYGPQLTSKMKGNWPALYRKFFKSPNFQAWFINRSTEVNRKLLILHLEALCTADISKWLHGKDEVEIVDLYMQLKRKSVKVKKLNMSYDYVMKLNNQILTVVSALPEDLGKVLKKSL